MSIINTSKHVRLQGRFNLYVILWSLYCLGSSFHWTNTIRNLSLSIYLSITGEDVPSCASSDALSIYNLSMYLSIYLSLSTNGGWFSWRCSRPATRPFTFVINPSLFLTVKVTIFLFFFYEKLLVIYLSICIIYLCINIIYLSVIRWRGCLRRARAPAAPTTTLPTRTRRSPRSQPTTRERVHKPKKKVY